MKPVAWAALLLLGITAGCRKHGTAPSAGNSVNDSALLYSRDLYLWYKNIPSNFNADQYDDPNAVMEAIRTYSTESGFTGPVDRWSFAVPQSQWDDLSQGISGDLGLGVFFLSTSDLRVSYVERESPAGKAGIERSWQITGINGNTNMTTGNADFIANAIYYGTAATITFKKPDGNSVTIPLTAGIYQEYPVYVDSVYTLNAEKVGYMVLNSFLGDTTGIKQELDRVFTRFTDNQVQDVIVDLRYNGGGYVSLQSYLANYLVPAAGNGDVMEVQEYNDRYSRYNTTTRFTKKGALNLDRLFVIVSQSTASASELLINSLKPYMNVILVGPSATHGKPVGFFPTPVGDWYIFPVSFRTTNKNGDGNYFNGLPLSYQVMDGLDKPWGDVSESCLGTTLHYINTGSFARLAASARISEGLQAAVQNGNTALGQSKFKGTIGRVSGE